MNSVQVLAFLAIVLAVMAIGIALTLKSDHEQH
jgi:hypothetical protein